MAQAFFVSLFKHVGYGGVVVYGELGRMWNEVMTCSAVGICIWPEELKRTTKNKSG